MTATQQQNRITLGKAARRVTIRICGKRREWTKADFSDLWGNAVSSQAVCQWQMFVFSYLQALLREPRVSLWWPSTSTFEWFKSEHWLLKIDWLSLHLFFSHIKFGVHHLHCTSGRMWGNGWPPPTPGVWRSPTGCHTGHMRTYSVRKERTLLNGDSAWQRQIWWLTPQPSYWQISCKGFWYSVIIGQKFSNKSLFEETHLWFNTNFDDAASYGEDVTDDEEDVPAVNELQPVGPGHFSVQGLLEEVHVLLKKHTAAGGGVIFDEKGQQKSDFITVLLCLLTCCSTIPLSMERPHSTSDNIHTRATATSNVKRE